MFLLHKSKFLLFAVLALTPVNIRASVSSEEFVPIVQQIDKTLYYPLSTFGVFGKGGVGKTTFIEYLRKILPSLVPEVDFLFLDLDTRSRDLGEQVVGLLADQGKNSALPWWDHLSKRLLGEKSFKKDLFIKLLERPDPSFANLASAFDIKDLESWISGYVIADTSYSACFVTKNMPTGQGNFPCPHGRSLRTLFVWQLIYLYYMQPSQYAKTPLVVFMDFPANDTLPAEYGLLDIIDTAFVLTNATRAYFNDFQNLIRKLTHANVLPVLNEWVPMPDQDVIIEVQRISDQLGTNLITLPKGSLEGNVVIPEDDLNHIASLIRAGLKPIKENEIYGHKQKVYEIFVSAMRKAYGENNFDNDFPQFLHVIQ